MARYSWRCYLGFGFSLLAGCFLLTGCATSRLFINPCSHEDLTIELGSEDAGLLTGVACAVLGSMGVKPCPSTDDIGRTCISKVLLLSHEAQVVQFCKAGYYCGALKIHEDQDFFAKADHTLFLLARKPSRPATTASCPTGSDLAIHVEDPDGRPLPAASLYLLEEELQQVGETDPSGRLCFAAVRGRASKAVLVCRNGFFCGLLRPADLPPLDGTLIVSLARFALP